MIITGEIKSEYHEILSGRGMDLLVHLHRKLHYSRKQLLQNRIKIEKNISQGNFPTFLPETKNIRDGSWVIGMKL
jgi:malate synthase